MSPTTVILSGASGFIALHTVQALIKKGYRVVGSVRSEEKGEYVKQASVNPALFSYEIVEDIAKEGAFDEIVKKHQEATVFLHTASPFHFNPTDIEKDLLQPAINGTTTALRSIKKFGPNIKRVVVTSSFAAMATAEIVVPSEVPFDETSWNQITWEASLTNPMLGYCGSKTFAEKAAWDFVKNEKPDFILSTVNPTYVFGPQPTDKFSTNSLNTSSEIINGFLKMSDPNANINPIKGPAIDVRDVAAAHVVAFEKEEAKNERLLLVTGTFTEQTILDVLHKQFPEQTKNIPVGTPGSDKEEMSKFAKINNEKTRNILGFEFISVEKTIADSARQILEVQGKL